MEEKMKNAPNLKRRTSKLKSGWTKSQIRIPLKKSSFREIDRAGCSNFMFSPVL